MSPEESSSGSGTKVILIVLAVVVSVFLVCAGLIVVMLVAIAAIGTNANRTFSQVAASIQASPPPGVDPGAIAKQILDDLAAGRIDDAYNNKTTRAFRARQDLNSFRRLVQNNPALKNHTSTSFQTIGPQRSYSATYRGKDGSVDLKMIPEDAQWKVDELTITPPK